LRRPPASSFVVLIPVAHEVRRRPLEGLIVDDAIETHCFVRFDADARPFVPLYFGASDNIVAVSAVPDENADPDRIGGTRFKQGFGCKIGVAETLRQPVIVFSQANADPSQQQAMEDLIRFPRWTTWSTRARRRVAAECLTHIWFSGIERDKSGTVAAGTSRAQWSPAFVHGRPVGDGDRTPAHNGRPHSGAALRVRSPPGARDRRNGHPPFTLLRATVDRRSAIGGADDAGLFSALVGANCVPYFDESGRGARQTSSWSLSAPRGRTSRRRDCSNFVVDSAFFGRAAGIHCLP
jgi:hypothetical protein